jgi:5'-phosphate synthase pdxT subunit
MLIKGVAEEPPFHTVFIRAPVVTSVENGVDVLGCLDDGRIIAVRQGHLLATAFHPELTNDSRFHQYFLDLIQDQGNSPLTHS